jgi:predicted nucleotidyltransferase
MIGMDKIRKFSEQIVRMYHPRRIVLFGSYAYGTPTADSDVDLLVILPFRGKSQYKSLEILQKVNPRFPVDLIVRTPGQVRKRLAWNDFFFREVMEKGKVLYETPDR